jgi:hypothetical protein
MLACASFHFTLHHEDEENLEFNSLRDGLGVEVF